MDSKDIVEAPSWDGSFYLWLLFWAAVFTVWGCGFLCGVLCRRTNPERGGSAAVKRESPRPDQQRPFQWRTPGGRDRSPAPLLSPGTPDDLLRTAGPVPLLRHRDSRVEMVPTIGGVERPGLSAEQALQAARDDAAAGQRNAPEAIRLRAAAHYYEQWLEEMPEDSSNAGVRNAVARSFEVARNEAAARAAGLNPPPRMRRMSPDGLW